MGNLLCKFFPYNPFHDRNGSRSVSRRNSSAPSSLSSWLDKNKNLRKANRQKMLKISDHLHIQLFLHGRMSDVEIEAVDKTWKLHKSVLKQSPYFEGMFSGAWKETEQEKINIHFVDPNITANVLDVVFSSFYKHNVYIESEDVLAVLSAASFLLMDDLKSKCAEVMVASINIQTIHLYLEASEIYNLRNVNMQCFKWLNINLMTCVCTNLQVLKQISSDLMRALMKSSELIVIESEYSLYLMLRLWLFLNLYSEWKNMNYNEALQTCSRYFEHRNDQRELLTTEEGLQYAPPFKALRLWYLPDVALLFNQLHKDCIIPLGWLYPALMNNWQFMSSLCQRRDIGSFLPFEIFNLACQRLGIVLHTQGHHSWRWSGFNFGLNLEWYCDGQTLQLKRLRQSSSYALPLCSNRNFILRATIFSLNEQKQIKCSQTTPLITLKMDENDQVTLLHMRNNMEYPLIVSINLLAA